MVGTIVDTATQAKRIKRPNFSTEFKRQVVEATLQPDASAALIAREHSLYANLLFKWRRQYLAGAYGLPDIAAPAPIEPQTPALNWLPVSVASQPRDADARDEERASRRKCRCEIEVGRVHLRIFDEVPAATLTTLVKELSR
jgi:transposase